MKSRNKIYYLLIIILAVLFTIRVVDSAEEKKIVKVLNHYEEVDKIVVINDKNKYEVLESDFANCKNSLKPVDILNKKHGNEITKELGDKIIDIEYYIGNQKLLKSTIYSLNNQPKGELEHFYFEFNDKYYTMMVDGNFRSINHKDIDCLSKYL